MRGKLYAAFAYLKHSKLYAAILYVIHGKFYAEALFILAAIGGMVCLLGAIGTANVNRDFFCACLAFTGLSTLVSIGIAIKIFYK